MLWPTLLVVILGFAAFGWYIERSVASDLLSTVDEELVRAANARGRQRGRPPGDGIAADGSDGTEVAAATSHLEFLVLPGGEVRTVAGSDPDVLGIDILKLQLTAHPQTVGSDPRFRVAIDRASDGIRVTALSLEEVDRSVRRLRRDLLLGGLTILAIVAAVVWSIATMVARPVTRIAKTMSKVAGGALDTQVDPPSGSKETSELASGLDEMLGQLRLTIDEREQAATDATKARDNMRRFLADASHELRTPLTALRGYSDLHQKGMLADGEDLDRAMARVGSESKRLSKLVDDMLLLSQSQDRSAETNEVGAVDVVALVGVVAADLRAAYPGADIVTAANSGAAIRVDGVADRLHQALLNLGANAVQHGGGSQVEFVVENHDDVAVRVIDHGAGIPEELAEQIFLPFFRADASRSRTTTGGAGLGLAIASEIAAEHGASLSHEQTSGGGATFVLRFSL